MNVLEFAEELGNKRGECRAAARKARAKAKDVTSESCLGLCVR
jgi:hypothetical protein